MSHSSRRYSAYAKGLVDYIVETTHEDNTIMREGSRTPDGKFSSTLAEDVRATCDKVGFEQLKVLSAEDGATADEAFVTFQAFFKVRGQRGQRAQGFHTQSFRERSRFLRQGEKWLFIEGDQDWE
jgi:uncharacterized protein YchJ